jgi:hypothetical protein
MKPETELPCPQEIAIVLFPELDISFTHTNGSFDIHFNIIFYVRLRSFVKIFQKNYKLFQILHFTWLNKFLKSIKSQRITGLNTIYFQIQKKDFGLTKKFSGM